MQKNGEGVDANPYSASFFFLIDSNLGLVKSTYVYAEMLNKGIGILINKMESARYYKQTALKWHVKSMNKYANLLENGELGIPNKKVAMECYKIETNKE